MNISKIASIAITCLVLTCPQANAAKPTLSGTLLFHRYPYYGAASEIWEYNFSNNQLFNLSAGWGLYDPINATWNYNKSQITFMAETVQNGSWDVFLYTVSSGSLVNLTNGRQPRSEDPRFSPNGFRICYKETPSSGFSQLRIMDLGGAITNLVTSSSIHHSMPCYTDDATALVYSRDVSPLDSIWEVNIDGSNDHQLGSGGNSYYPFVTGPSNYLFSKTNASGHDQTYQGNYTNSTITSMPYNNANYDYSDAVTVPGTNYVIVSSDNPNLAGASGGYDLYVASTVTGQMWNLNQYNAGINGGKEELGASYK